MPDTIPVKREERESLLSTPVGLLFHELVHSPEGLVRSLDSPRFLEIPLDFPSPEGLVRFPEIALDFPSSCTRPRGWCWQLSAGVAVRVMIALDASLL